MSSGLSRALVDLVGAALPLGVRDLEGEIAERLAKAPVRLNEYGYDPFGFHPEAAARALALPALLYRYWFRVEPHDIDRVPPGRVLLVANHAGQVPYDGAMLGMAMLLAAEPPRVARGMGEYFIWRLPFLSVLAARGGTMPGTPENCAALLESESCVMVFPEGARGINKPFSQRYRLEPFGLGFLRLALETGTPVVPVGIVGSEEQQPGLVDLRGPARALGLPSLPITLTFPLLGPAGLLVALPVKYRIYFGKPLHFEGHPSDEDAVIEQQVDVVREAVEGLIARGRRERQGVFR